MRYLTLLIVLLGFFLTGCAGGGDSDQEDAGATDDDSGGGIDDDAGDDDDDDDAGDDDDDDDDDNDDNDDDNDDNNDDNDDDNDDDDDDNDDDDTVEPIFQNPHDGKLYAAAGYAVITPNDLNHPCPKYMGGTALNRIATDTHDDLEARAIVLEYNGVHAVLVSLDLVGLSQPDVQKVTRSLAGYGVDPNHVILSSTHTHEAPDTMGIWGADVLHTGRCPTYIHFLVDTITDLVVELAGQMTPVTVQAAETEMTSADPTWPHLQRDSRQPVVTNDRLTAARLLDGDGQTVATVVNWQSHPEVLIWMNRYSADFPRWARQKLEQVFGGVCVYFSGTVGGLLTPLDAPVPLYTVDGEPVYSGDDPVLVSENSEEKMWSLGYNVADSVTAALEDPRAIDAELAVESTVVEIPVLNPIHILAMVTGLVEPFDDLDTSRPWFCGLFGCAVQPLIHLALGQLHFVTLPGEAFAEMSVGRAEMSVDFGAPWGVSVFPAMTGYRSALPEGHLLMDLGLANSEYGYLVPGSDLHWLDHPDFYEEQYCISGQASDIIREGIVSLLAE